MSHQVQSNINWFCNSVATKMKRLWRLNLQCKQCFARFFTYHNWKGLKKRIKLIETVTGENVSISCILISHHTRGESGEGGGVWRAWGGPLAFVWESLKKEKKKNMLFLIKINLFFFLWLANCDWVHLHCPHFPPQTLGLCKKSSCIWSNLRRRWLLSVWCYQQLPTCPPADRAAKQPRKETNTKQKHQNERTN